MPKLTCERRIQGNLFFYILRLPPMKIAAHTTHGQQVDHELAWKKVDRKLMMILKWSTLGEAKLDVSNDVIAMKAEVHCSN